MLNYWTVQSSQKLNSTTAALNTDQQIRSFGQGSCVKIEKSKSELASFCFLKIQCHSNTFITQIYSHDRRVGNFKVFF